MSPLRRNAALALGLGALLAGRALVASRQALTAGEAALARGDSPEAVRLLRQGAQWSLPANPYARASLDALEAHARASEARGQHALGLDAWRAVRASLLSTRGIVPPDPARLARANHHLAHLMAQLPPAPDEREASPRAREERHLALLQDDRAPDPAWTVVMGLGLGLLVAAALGAALRGWDPTHRPIRGPLGRAAAAGALGVGLFVLGLWRA